MKIRVDVNVGSTEPEVVIRVNDAAKGAALAQKIARLTDSDRLTLGQRGHQYQVKIADILFLEAADHQVTVHTAKEMFMTRLPLYELAEQLPESFQRISKSAILNRDQVRSLTKSVTGNLVRFRESSKQVYVSRRYYKELKNRLERKG
ncbi:response regulator [Levilactobacillus senmaizukei DSM 21775 = NBRC 103853]|uniref:Response regulator n=1 Tax=Levilactobacillus senmaizukei DSM 21775 = NBRC 103853 TaxID=1423803 RepID=A0A0R2DEH5_9LACO|nr:LytTR family DNA-binding domain-containing protein [Levilactobacillus senmaizukei]KRN02424.1 response regulator [Levilactobacillus senmaizukei DSM 21775 = NBRC 103853]